MKNFDCIVVGGGIIGMTTARELSIQGLNVALFDKGPLGKEASWVAGGILSSMRPWSEHPRSAELSQKGKQCYPAFVEALSDETGIDTEYTVSGLLMAGIEDIDKTVSWAKINQISYSQERKYIPTGMNLSENAVLLPDIAQVKPSQILKALSRSLKLKGVTVFENTEVLDINVVDSEFRAVKYDDGEVTADSLVLASGAWSSQLLRGINKSIKVKPVRGQMLCLKVEQQKFQSIILDGGHYFIPRIDGHLLVGSTMEHSGFVNETTSDAKNELMSWACSVWPEVIEAKFVNQWSGLRPATDNAYPYIGLLKNINNIFINTGHFRKGILQAPVSAKLIAEMVCDTRLAEEISM